VNLVSLGPWELGLAALLVGLVALLSLPLRLRMARPTLVAGTRMVIQLLLVGLVLEVLFAHAVLWWVALMAVVMLLVAGREVMARQKRRFQGGWGFGAGTAAMFVSSFAVAVIALTVMVRPEPWYLPQYAIPMLGMLLGNTMTGVALSMDRLTESAWERRGVIEARLALGHSWGLALSDIRREAARAGMIPTINSMASAGVVNLPGMMTGQILAGAPPMEAVKYQILIMLLIVASVGLGTATAMWLGTRRLGDERQRLRLDRLRSEAR
jgi:putative ABC transport system permease protein